MPHPLALFSLNPIGKRAEEVVKHSSNKHLISILEGKLVIDIGHVRSISDNTTVVTLERNGDVFVEGSSISKVQCSFEIDPTTKFIMFYDRSHSQTSQVFGKNATPFEYGRPRKVVMQLDVNTIIGMGSVRHDLVQFELIWHHNDPVEMMEVGKDRETATLEENPRFAQTIDGIDTVLPSQRDTRMCKTLVGATRFLILC